MPPKKRGRPPKPKPLTQKAEKEMMGQEDIASTAIELTEAQKRMAKAREAKKAKAVAPSKENITLKIDEAPYGFTASGRKRTKPLKEKPPKAPKKLPKINDPNFETKMKKLQEQLTDAPPKAPKAKKVKVKKVKAKKVYPPTSVNATAREQIGMIEEDLDAREREKDARQRKKDNPTDLPIKTARRYIQLLFKGKDTLQDLMYQTPSWTQDGYYTTSGDMDYTEIQDEIARLYSNYKDTFDEAVKWFKDAYDDKRWDKPNEKTSRDDDMFNYEDFGLEENRHYKEPDDEDYDEDWEEFNGAYILGDWNDFEGGLEDMDRHLKVLIVELEKGGFMGSIGWSPSSSEASSEASSPASSRSSSASSVGTARWDEGSPSSSRSSSRSSSGYGLYGGALSAKELKGLLGASYDPKIDKVGDFVLDSKLSTKTSKVYHNPNSGQTVVAHKGTEGILDWGNNAVYALGGKTAYKLTPRYKEAEKIQKKAESKYGAKNVSTIGHSQGGLQAELLGGKSKEIITLNKATRPFESNKNKNQTDVRSGRDVVSALNPFEKKSSKNVEIQGETYNPLAEHSGDVLDRLDENQMIGEGIRRMIEGEGTEAQRFIANMLRSRFNPKELQAISPALEAEGRRSLSKLYPNINRTVYDMENIQGALNSLTHSADATGYKWDNPYMDYEERPDHIDRRTTYGKPTLPPQQLIDVALNSYFDMVYNLHRNLSGRGRSEWVFGDEMKTIPKALQPFYDTFLRNKANVIVPKFLKKTIPEARATIEKLREAKRPEVFKKFGEKVREKLDKKNMKKNAWWIDLSSEYYIPLRKMIENWERLKNGTDEKGFRKAEGDIATFAKQLREETTQFKENYGIVGNLPDDLRPPFKLLTIIPPLPNWNNRKFLVFENPFPPLPKEALKAMGGKETPAFQPKEAFPKLGKGLPIDFESMNWGSLTEQMKAYNSQHSKDLDLEGFARMIVADPKSFQKRTLQRARFYINVLLPKKK